VAKYVIKLRNMDKYAILAVFEDAVIRLSQILGSESKLEWPGTGNPAARGPETPLSSGC
jgi:hypothetical protein